MKLEKVSAIAEIISSIAVVVTLVYLASQTRLLASQTQQLAIQTEQTNSALVSSSRASLMAADLDFILTAASDEDISVAAMTGDYSELSPKKVAQEEMLEVAFIKVREYAWFQYQDGLLDESAWNSFLSPLLSSLNNPVGLTLGVWTRLSGQFDPDFERVVNDLLKGN